MSTPHALRGAPVKWRSLYIGLLFALLLMATPAVALAHPCGKRVRGRRLTGAQRPDLTT